MKNGQLRVRQSDLSTDSISSRPSTRKGGKEEGAAKKSWGHVTRGWRYTGLAGVYWSVARVRTAPHTGQRPQLMSSSFSTTFSNPLRLSFRAFSFPNQATSSGEIHAGFKSCFAPRAFTRAKGWNSPWIKTPRGVVASSARAALLPSCNSDI